MNSFQHYISLGDSISISLYARMDYMERHNTSNPPEDLGAAMLFFQNHDMVWPEFKANDLVTLFPEIDFYYCASDGAKTETVLKTQLPSLPANIEGNTLITLTIGGNDLLYMMGKSQKEGDELFTVLLENLKTILQEIDRLLPSCVVLLGTVYDPSDDHPEIMWRNYQREVEWFHRYNDKIRKICRQSPNYILADIYQHCYGHGYSVPTDERWYFATIEPGLLGASEIRNLWFQQLQNYLSTVN